MHAWILERRAQNLILDVIERIGSALDRDPLGAPWTDVSLRVEQALALDIADRCHRISVENHLECDGIVKIAPERESVVARHLGRHACAELADIGIEGGNITGS